MVLIGGGLTENSWQGILVEIFLIFLWCICYEQTNHFYYAKNLAFIQCIIIIIFLITLC